MLVQWLKLTTEDLRSRLYNMAVEGEVADVKLVCQDGNLSMHRPVLDLYLPEVATWIPHYHKGFDVLIHMLGMQVEESVEAVRKLYLEDNPSDLRKIFGLSETPQKQYDQYDGNSDDESFNVAVEPMIESDSEEPLLDAAGIVKMEAELPVDTKFEDEEQDEKKPTKIPTKFLVCPGCKQKFTSTACLQYHEIKIHNSTTLEEKHKCNQHPKEKLKDFQALVDHFKLEHSNIKASERFEEIEREEMRMIDSVPLDLDIPDDSKLKCRTCKRLKGSDKLIELHNHYNLMHTPIQCPQCEKLCPNKAALSKHLQTHDETREKNVLCTLCGTKFHLKGSLAQHMKYVHEMVTFKCDQCPYTCRSTTQLKDHVESKHTDITYTCPTCGKTCQSRWLWKNHMKSHSSVKNFGCDYCDKRFRTNEKLKDHQSVHNNIKFPCNICGSQFSRIPTLKAHMRIHNDPYKCPECSKIFETGQKYREHMNTHTGAKPFKCEACQQAYSSSSSLSHHRKSCSLYINLQKSKEEPLDIDFS